jgi:hypothetical protein
VGDLLHRKIGDVAKERLTIASALTRIDMGSLVFFIGILLAVATLEHTHILVSLAVWLNQTIGRHDVIVLIICPERHPWQRISDDQRGCFRCLRDAVRCVCDRCNGGLIGCQARVCCFIDT